MKTIICDICEHPIVTRQYKVIIKKEWCSFTESFFDRMDICEDCANKIIENIKKLEGKNEDKKKTFKKIKHKYDAYIKQTEHNIEVTNEKLYNYEPKYGNKEDLHRDMFRYIDRYNLLYELLEDIELLEGNNEH